MIKQFSGISVREYSSKDRKLIENFRKESFKEGNDSLSMVKYNPDNIRGQTWMTFIGGDLASISVCEASHYTGDPDIAVRICRYHILKKYRHCNAGFRMLFPQVNWAKQNGFKVIYWTRDIRDRSLNALYQHRRRMIGKSHFFESALYKSFKIQEKFLFKVSPKSNFLQYIYSKILQPGYIWKPKKNVIPIEESMSIPVKKNTEKIKKYADDTTFYYRG